MRCRPRSQLQGIGMSFVGKTRWFCSADPNRKHCGVGSGALSWLWGFCRELWWPPTLLPSPSQGVFANALFPRPPLNSVQERYAITGRTERAQLMLISCLNAWGQSLPPSSGDLKPLWRSPAWMRSNVAVSQRVLHAGGCRNAFTEELSVQSR